MEFCWIYTDISTKLNRGRGGGGIGGGGEGKGRQPYETFTILHLTLFYIVV